MNVDRTCKTRNTDAVWKNHADGWANKDMDKIMADYDESSIMIINNIVYKGKANLEAVFERLFDIFSTMNAEFDPAVIEDRIVFTTWNATPCNTNTEFFGTDTFIIENGMITVQTIASPLYYQYPINILI